MRLREIITEAIDTEPIFQMATERLTAILGNISHADLVADYPTAIKPVSDALQAIAHSIQDAAHPLQVVIDQLPSGYNAKGAFDAAPDHATGYIYLELRQIFWVDDTDDPPEPVTMVNLLAKLFAHECMHYLQRLKAWGVSSRDTVRRSKGANPYFATAREVQAWAADVMRDLLQKFKTADAALAKLRTNDGLREVFASSFAFQTYARLRQTPGGQKVYRAFMEQLVRQLMQRRTGQVAAA